MHDMPRGGEVCSLVGAWINLYVLIKTVEFIDVLDY